ncbi:MAG: DUF4160 domain-containing protein [Limisphaerales bacterium]
MPEWVIDFAELVAVDELHTSFAQGPIIDDQGRRRIDEVQVARLGALSIQILSDEHPPPHFRVSYQGETANYRISDGGQMNGGLTRFYRNIRRWHSQNKQLLINTWNARRPTNCPVGIYREPGQADPPQ